MKREIKFRVWHNEWKKMYKVRSVHFNDKGDIIGLHYKLTGGRIGAAVCIDTYLEIDSIELMQFTGLLDKNGMEIYENDFVTSKSHLPEVMQVEFIEGAFCMTHPTINDYPIDINHFYPSIGTDLVVIGNIYETPELIK